MVKRYGGSSMMWPRRRLARVRRREWPSRRVMSRGGGAVLQQRQRHQRTRKVCSDATNLHHNVMLILVHVGHHPILPRGRKLNTPKDLSGEFIARMEFQRSIGSILNTTLTERPSLDQKIAHDHLNRPPSSTGIRYLHVYKKRMVANTLRGLTNRQRPEPLAGVHLECGELVIHGLKKPQTFDGRQATPSSD